MNGKHSSPSAHGTEDLVNVPPMGGLALMALDLALDRANSSAPWWVKTPPARDCRCGPCENYFPIIDRIARGEAP